MIEQRFGIELAGHELPAGHAHIWSAAVRRELARIAKARTGQVVLNSLRWYIREGRATLKIWPWTAGRENAQTSSWQDEMPRAVHIQYSADVWRHAYEADEMLLHELAHAVRHASGKHDKCDQGGVCRLQGALRTFTNREEFVAVLIENIYRSDPTRVGGRMPLRGSHQGSGAMAKELAGSFRFFAAGSHVFHLVAQFVRDNPVFAQLLANVRARFNPLAAFFSDRQRAFRISMGTDRDAATYAEDLFDRLEGDRMLRQMGVATEVARPGGR